MEVSQIFLLHVLLHASDIERAKVVLILSIGVSGGKEDCYLRKAGKIDDHTIEPANRKKK